MFVVEVDRENYEYDVHSLVKAFYPEEQVSVLIPEMREEKKEQFRKLSRMRIRRSEAGAEILLDGKEYRWEWQDAEQGGEGREKARKDGFKRFLYRTLKEVTGRVLPWGNLTGIRPTKIAFQMLEEGKGNQEILERYRVRHDVTREKAELAVEIAGRERALLASVGPGGGQEEGYSLYVGIPFCPTTCLYCSFTSYPVSVYRTRQSGIGTGGWTASISAAGRPPPWRPGSLKDCWRLCGSVLTAAP